MNKQYFLNRQVIIVPYDYNWSVKFEKEKNKILSVIGMHEVIVEHIGSTAIARMAAKPILDIMVGTKDLAIADACIEPLRTIGYEYVSELEKDFPQRRYLHKGPNLPNKHFHMHMVVIDNDFWRRQLAFRDYMRQNIKAAKEYQQLKEQLSSEYKKDIAGYCEAKTEFILKILKLAETK